MLTNYDENVSKGNDEQEIQRLIESIKEKDFRLKQVEKELIRVNKSKNEIIKLIQNKDEQLANDIIERFSENIRNEEDAIKNTEENRNNEKGLKMKDDNRHEKIGGGYFLKNHIALKINEGAVIDDKLFNSFQKELLAYYSANMEEIKKHSSSEEKTVRLDELTKVDWQYVLVFKNPDYNDSKQTIDEELCNKIYDKCFWPDRRGKSTRQAKFQENMVFRHILKHFIDKETSGNEIEYLLNNGKSLTKDQTDKWVFNLGPPKDILTLIRNISMFKINKVLHMETSTVLSENGDLIYVLIHSGEQLLRDEADWIEYPLQFEVGSTDLISLEPCDNKMRPYRFIKEHKPDDIRKLEEELYNFTMFLYNDEEYEALANQTISEQIQVTTNEWAAYKAFLTYLQTKRNDVLNLVTKHKDLKGLILRELYIKAFEHVFNLLKFKLKNIWDYFEANPSGAFKSYYREIDQILQEDKAESFWKRYVNRRTKKVSLFKNLDKIKLILSRLYSQLRLDKMHALGLLENYYPLHSRDYSDSYKADNKMDVSIVKEQQVHIELNEVDETHEVILQKLSEPEQNYTCVKESWKLSLLGKVPANEIRNYFGEKVAFYFKFLSLYTFYLFVLGILGIIVYIVQNRDDLESKSIEYYYQMGWSKSMSVKICNTIYSLFVIIWSAIFLEHWKRTQSTLATEWGQTKFENSDQNLPSFSGHKRRSPINDVMDETFYSNTIHVLKMVLAYIVSIIIVIIVIGIVLVLLYFRNWLVINKVGGAGNQFIVNVPTILNVVQIVIFNFIYTKIAYFFNDFENHKTYDSYESSLIGKTFIFQFVNSFNSLIIIAFIKKSIDFMGGCVKSMQFGKTVSAYNFCDEELENQMITIALINFVKNFSELGIPWLLNKYKNRKNNQKFDQKDEDKQIENVEKFRQFIERQNNLNNYNTGFIDATFDDYLELAVQFGFVTLFAMSFSLLPIIAFITNIIEVEVDKTKLLSFAKRPNPISVSNIGNWYYVFELLSFLSIFSNVGILIYTYNNYYELDTYGKAVLYMALVFFYIIMKMLVARFIPDIPDKTIELQKRQNYIVEKMCDGIDQEPNPKVLYAVDLNIICKN